MLKHIMNYAPAKIIPGIVNFLSLMIFARIFTPSELGNYNYIMSIITLVSATLFSWIRLSSFRFFNIYIENLNRSVFYSYVFSLNFIATLVVILLLFIPLLFGYHPNLYILLIIGSVAILISVFFEQAMSFARSELDSKSFALFSILRPIIQLIIILVLTQILTLDEVSIFIALALSYLILLFFYFNRIKKRYEIKLFFVSPRRYKEILRSFFYYGYPLTFTFLFSIILSTSDRIFIKHYHDAESVAIYSMGYDITSFIITNIFMVINFSFIPVILKRIDKNNIVEAQGKIRDYFYLLIIILIPVTLFLFVFAEELTKYVLGGVYNNPETVMTIKMISITTFLSGIKAYFFDFSFKFGNKTKLQIYPVIVAAIINVLLNFILIPSWGLYGAILATLIAYTCSLILSIILGRRAFRLNWYSKGLVAVISQLVIFSSIYFFIEVDGHSLKSSLINITLFLLFFCLFILLNFKNIRRILK